MRKPLSIDDNNFDQMVLQDKNPAVVDLWAPWCKPCLMLAPILDELSEEYTNKIDFFKLDIEQNPKTASRYGIMSIPTVLIFKQGKPVSNIVGFRSKAELKEGLDALIG